MRLDFDLILKHAALPARPAGTPDNQQYIESDDEHWKRSERDLAEIAPDAS